MDGEIFLNSEFVSREEFTIPAHVWPPILDAFSFPACLHESVEIPETEEPMRDVTPPAPQVFPVPRLNG